MYKHLAALSILGASALLSACGGHSGNGDSADNGAAGAGGINGAGGASSASNAAAEGAWSGTNLKNDAVDILLLENGDLYAMFSSVTIGLPPVLTFDKGSYSVTGTTLTAPVTQYNDNGTKVNGTLNATVSAQTSIKGTATNVGNTQANSFSVTPTGSIHSGYDYNTPATLGAITGAWSNAYLLGQTTPFVFSIDAAGVLAATNLGCSLSGSVKPRSSGKNVYTISLSFGQSPCTAPGKTFSGVAISYLTSSGQRQFTAAMQDPTLALGSMLYAQR